MEPNDRSGVVKATQPMVDDPGEVCYDLDGEIEIK
jgi:hypothetical protein